MKRLLNRGGVFILDNNFPNRGIRIYENEVPTLTNGLGGKLILIQMKVGKINSSQDGVIFDTNGEVQCLSSGHGNVPKILINEK